MANKRPRYTVDGIVDYLKKEYWNETIEGQLLRRQMIRELYKQIGEPKEEEFPMEFRHAYKFDRYQGYTTEIRFRTAQEMKDFNNSPTDWHIKRASATKIRIEHEYRNEGWHCEVQAYNVICAKYVPHPKYKNIWVMFHVTRDVAKYEYVIEEK